MFFGTVAKKAGEGDLSAPLPRYSECYHKEMQLYVGVRRVGQYVQPDVDS